MCLGTASKFVSIRQNGMVLSAKLIQNLFKSLAISGIFLYIFYIILSNHPCCQSTTLIANLRQRWAPFPPEDSPTNITHIVFGIAGSAGSWKHKRTYAESWWRPNKTRGFLFLDRTPQEHIPWPQSSPPFRVSENTSRYEKYNRHPMRHAIRMARVILEMFREENNGVRWYVMADDDTIFFVDNMVEVLAKYDHKKYFYIGTNSECVTANFDHSFEMGFGGAGYALSYPLAVALVNNLDACIKTYPTVYGSDHILQSCIADLGVSLTREKGFHQIDLHSDISGLLSAHPQSPILSLHHLDVVDPIFPSMNRHESLNHLMKAAKADQSRLLQQTVCFHKQMNWSFSISWGYSAHIYENIYPPSILQRPLQTFTPWKRTARPPYMFNTRFLSKDPCEVPHVFFFDSLEEPNRNQMITSYTRRFPRRLPACTSSGNHSADFIFEVRVLSTVKGHNEAGSRRECCDVIHVGDKNITEIKFRACMSNEIVA